MIEIRIDGLDDLVRSLDNVGTKMKDTDRFADTFLYKVEREAKKLTPVDTGTLRRSIHTWRGGFAKGYVATNTDYAIYVHEGWGSNKSKGRRQFMEMGTQIAMADLDDMVDKFLNTLI